MCKTTFGYLPHYPPTPESGEPHARTAARLEILGDLESWKGNHKEGLAYLEEALHLYEEEGNDKGIAGVLRKQAAMAYRDSNFFKKRDAASAALEKCRSLQDDIGEADALYWLGSGGSTFEDLRRNLQESLTIFRAKGNSMGVAKCLRKLGEIYQRVGEDGKALHVLEEAVGVASGCGDRLGEADALGTLATTHWNLDCRDLAISTLQKAQKIAKSIGWEPGLGTCLYRLGVFKFHQVIHTEAEKLLRESVRIARSSDAGWRLAEPLGFLGACIHAQGRHGEAISALEESCRLHQHLADGFWADFAFSATLLGDTKSILGQKEEALAWYDTAIAEWRKSGDHEEVSKCLAAKDAILADMKRRDEGVLHAEASS